MSVLTYVKMNSENDNGIPKITAIYREPVVAQYLSIGEDYFRYVTTTENVHFYKVYENRKIIGVIHLEKQADVLSMSILIFPEFQRMGLGTKIIKDIQFDIFGVKFDRIEVSVDEENIASLKLFENAGFIRTSKDGKLINLVYQRSIYLPETTG